MKRPWGGGARLGAPVIGGIRLSSSLLALGIFVLTEEALEIKIASTNCSSYLNATNLFSGLIFD
jgi:hypothetical protein